MFITDKARDTIHYIEDLPDEAAIFLQEAEEQTASDVDVIIYHVDGEYADDAFENDDVVDATDEIDVALRLCENATELLEDDIAADLWLPERHCP